MDGSWRSGGLEKRFGESTVDSSTSIPPNEGHRSRKQHQHLLIEVDNILYPTTYTASGASHVILYFGQKYIDALYRLEIDYCHFDAVSFFALRLLYVIRELVE